MGTSNRKNRWHRGGSIRAFGAKGATLLVLLLSILIAVPSTSALAATVLMVGGMNQSTIDDVWMRQALNGKFTGTDPVSNTPWQRVSVNWPAD